MPNYFEFFLIGLFGGAHCIGMCGGFVGLYTLRTPPGGSTLPSHLLYNLGRIATYSAIGGLVGAAGSFLAHMARLRGIPGGVLLLSGAGMIALGLTSAGVFGNRGLREDVGITELPLFRGALRRILGLESSGAAFLLGLLLGLLPCGLLYPVFLAASSSGGFVPGMLSLSAFGLGTVPAMLSLGLLVTRLQSRLRLMFFRVAAGLVVLLGIRTFLRGLAFNGWIAPGAWW